MTEKKAAVRMPAGLTPRLLSRDQAAAYCGISVSHFDATVGSEVPPVRLLNKTVRWDVRALDRWIDLAGGAVPEQYAGRRDAKNIEARLNGSENGSQD